MTRQELEERCNDVRRLLAGQHTVADLLCEELRAAYSGALDEIDQLKGDLRSMEDYALGLKHSESELLNNLSKGTEPNV